MLNAILLFSWFFFFLCVILSIRAFPFYFIFSVHFFYIIINSSIQCVDRCRIQNPRTNTKLKQNQWTALINTVNMGLNLINTKIPSIECKHMLKWAFLFVIIGNSNIWSGDLFEFRFFSSFLSPPQLHLKNFFVFRCNDERLSRKQCKITVIYLFKFILFTYMLNNEQFKIPERKRE